MAAKFVIEIESIKDGLNVLRPNAGPGVLDMYAAGPGQRCMLPITRAQFREYSNDIEAFSTGAVPPLLGDNGEVLSPGRPTGNPVTIVLWVRDLVTGKRDSVTFAEAREALDLGADDSEALKFQQAEAKRLAEMTKDEDEDDEEDEDGSGDAELRPIADAAGLALNVRGS